MIGAGVGRVFTLVTLIPFVAMAVVDATALAVAVELWLLLGKCMAKGEVGAMAVDDDRVRPAFAFLCVPGEPGPLVAKGPIDGEALVMVTRTGPPPPTAAVADAATPGGGRGNIGASILIDRSTVVLRFIAGRSTVEPMVSLRECFATMP